MEALTSQAHPPLGARAAVPRGLVGVLHLPAMPGDPGYVGGGFDAALDAARRDADALLAGGIASVVVENFGSRPFPKGDASDRVPPHQVALMASVVREMCARFVSVGVNCLRNDAISALGIAAACGGAFVRVNVHTGAYVTDQGIIEGEAARSLRYRMSLGAEHVAILADVLVKHAQPLVPVAAGELVRDTLQRAMADAVVVTGSATGAPIDVSLLQQVRDAAQDCPVVLGSGLTTQNAATLVPLADAAIVGTFVKEGGDVRAPVDAERVRALVHVCRDSFRR